MDKLLNAVMIPVERALSALFPPTISSLGEVDNFPQVLKDHERANRTGVENPRGGAAVGTVVSGAQERQVILLGPRSAW